MYYKQTLCWTCQNACGGCSWSKRFIPVEGWDAKRRDVMKGQDHRTPNESYFVISCPQYVPDKPRKETGFVYG